MNTSEQVKSKTMPPGPSTMLYFLSVVHFFFSLAVVFCSHSHFISSMSFDHQTEVVCTTSEGADTAASKRMWLLVDRVLRTDDPGPIDVNLELLAMPFHDPQFLHPAILMSDPSMFFFVLFFGFD
jgi:hypothetical protein